jgi:hypothetical protein
MRNEWEEYGPVPVEEEKPVVPVWALAILALALSFAVGLVAMGKPDVQKEPSPITVLFEEANANREAILENQEALKEVGEQLNKVRDGIKSLDRKCSILGSGHNNNFHVIRYGKNPKDMIFIERDWHLDKLPPHLNIEDKDGFRKEYVDD